MSRTYSIACKKCNKSLWIGQGWPYRKVYLYNGISPDGKDYFKTLETFLFSHQDHELIFGDDEGFEYEDIEEE